jgi:hypothetical protein
VLTAQWIISIFDIIALVVQAIGGGMAAVNLQDGKSSTAGTNIMMASSLFATPRDFAQKTRP